MKVAVAAEGQGIGSRTDARFGRCPYFVVVDTGTMKCDSLPNPGAGATGGAGMKAVQSLVKAGVSAVIAGNVGPNAMAALQAAGITAYLGIDGTVGEAVAAYVKGTLVPIAGPTVPHHSGA